MSVFKFHPEIIHVKSNFMLNWSELLEDVSLEINLSDTCHVLINLFYLDNSINFCYFDKCMIIKINPSFLSYPPFI
jgi:hypothetical protein